MNEWITKKILSGLTVKKDTVIGVKISFYILTILEEIEKLIIIVIFYAVLGYFADIAVILTVIFILRPYIGGTHQDTFFKCITLTIIYCAVPIILARCIVVSCFVQILLTVVLFGIVCGLGPIASKYRFEYDGELLRKIKRKGTIALIIVNAMYIITGDMVKKTVTITLCVLLVDWMLARIEKITIMKKGELK